MKMKKAIAFAAALAITGSTGVNAFSALFPASAYENSEKNNAAADVQNSDMAFQADNSLGSLLAREIQGSYDESSESAQEQFNADYSIQNIDLEYLSADVYYNAENDCKLIVGLYSEDEQTMYTSVSVDAQKDTSAVSVQFELMPDDYFLVKAYLADSETLAPLSECYTNDFYTEEVQEFYSLTPDDFSDKDVLLFDDQQTENFAVFDSGTTVIPYQEGINTVTYQDSETGTYTIENISDEVAGLLPGDIAAIYYGEQMPIILKVDTISIDGNTADITSAEAALDEIFEFFRLNAASSEIEYDESDLADGVTAQTVYSEKNTDTVLSGDDDDDYKVEEEIKFELDDEGNKSAKVSTKLTAVLEQSKLEYKNEPELVETDPSLKADVTLSGEVTCTFSACLKYNFNKNGSGKTYAEFNISTDVSPKIKFSGNVSATIPFTYRSVKIPIYGGFYITFNPAIEFEAKAEIDFKTSFTVTAGVRYDETEADELSAIREWKMEEKEEGEVGLKVEGSLYIGLNLHPQIKWISDKILSFDVEKLGGGLLFEGTIYDEKVDFSREDILNDTEPAEYDTNLSDKETEFHTCLSCIDGEISLHSKIKAQLKLLNIVKKDSENKGPSITVELPDIHLAYFYVVLLDEEGKELTDAGFGKCPHKVFLLNIAFKDKDTGETIDGVQYELTDENGNSKTFNVSDYPKLWRKAGKYKISVSMDGYEDFTNDYNIEYCTESPATLLNRGLEEYNLYINDKITNKITVYLESIKHNVTINVTDEDGNPIDQPSISCSYNTAGTIGKIVNAVSNTVKFFGLIKSEEKAENSFEYSLPDGEHTFTIAKAGYDTVKETVTVESKDSEVNIVMKKTKKNVLVTVVDEDGNAIEDPVISIEGQGNTYIPEMSSPGEFVCELPLGTYTLSVSKDGYVSEDDEELVQREITVGLLDTNVSVMVTLKSIHAGASLLSGATSAFVTESGSLYMWGYNYYGQLGNGTKTDSSIPVKIMDNVKYVSISGNCSSSAITEDGSLYTWGDNEYGQLGNGTKTNSYTPIKIMDNIKSVCLEDFCSAAITEDGSLYMWGHNYYGQLGNGTTTDSSIPVKIMENVKNVSLGCYHSAAITEDGSLYTWGYNGYGELGNGTTTDSSIPVKIMDNVKSVILGEWHSAAITEDGSLYTWGRNCYGQLGNGTTTDSSIPVKIMENVKNVSLGCYHSAAITEDGSLYTWGYNGYGELGNGTTAASSIPVKIMENVKSVSLGYDNGAAITEDGSLYTWGYNYWGQLGNGTTKGSSYVPIKIELPIEAASASLQSSAISAEASSIVTESVSDTYIPNTIYNLYVLRDASKGLALDNISYINQYSTDENGTMNIAYNLSALQEEKDYFLIPYGYVPTIKNIVDETEAFDKDFTCTMCAGDTICFDTQQNNLTFSVSNPDIISLSEDGTCTALSTGTAYLTVVQDGLSTYNIEVTVENAFLIGDLDGDSEIQLSDATIALTIYAKNVAGLDISEYTYRQNLAADVNGNGDIEMSDATAILTYYAQCVAGLDPVWQDLAG